MSFTNLGPTRRLPSLHRVELPPKECLSEVLILRSRLPNKSFTRVRWEHPLIPPLRPIPSSGHFLLKKFSGMVDPSTSNWGDPCVTLDYSLWTESQMDGLLTPSISTGPPQLRFWTDKTEHVPIPSKGGKFFSFRNFVSVYPRLSDNPVNWRFTLLDSPVSSRRWDAIVVGDRVTDRCCPSDIKRWFTYLGVVVGKILPVSLPTSPLGCVLSSRGYTSVKRCRVRKAKMETRSVTLFVKDTFQTNLGFLFIIQSYPVWPNYEC